MSEGYLNDRFSPAAPPLDVQRELRAKNKKAATMDRGGSFIHRCDNCLHEGYGKAHACQGHPLGPPGKCCRCRQCWLAWLRRTWFEEIRDSRDTSVVRLAGDAFWSMYEQAARRNRSQADRYRRKAVTLPCAWCGKPVVGIKRLDKRGGPYCRGVSTCRVMGRKRDIAAAHAEQGTTPRGPGRPPKQGPLTKRQARAAAKRAALAAEVSPAAMQAAETDAAAMEAAQPGGQLHRRLRDQEAAKAQAAEPVEPAREAPEPSGAADEPRDVPAPVPAPSPPPQRPVQDTRLIWQRLRDEGHGLSAPPAY